jgi:hypothetical protein
MIDYYYWDLIINKDNKDKEMAARVAVRRPMAAQVAVRRPMAAQVAVRQPMAAHLPVGSRCLVGLRRRWRMRHSWTSPWHCGSSMASSRRGSAQMSRLAGSSKDNKDNKDKHKDKDKGRDVKTVLYARCVPVGG